MGLRDQTHVTRFQLVLTRCQLKALIYTFGMKPDPHSSDQEIWKWTLTSDAIASCFIQDIFDMSEHTGKGIIRDKESIFVLKFIHTT
jgi:hypothetical protein